MRRAVLYARVSSLDKEGDRLSGQLEMCRAYCAERQYAIIEELSESPSGQSGSEMDPPALSRALELARAGVYDCLVVRELDRLSRDVAKLLIVEKELKRAGVVVEFAIQQFSDDPEGQFMKTTYGAIAQLETSLITRRLRRGRLAKAKDGPLVHGHPPYGYQSQRDEHGRWSLAPDTREAEVVKLTFELYTVDKLPINALTRRLTELGAPTRSGKARWNRNSVYRILRNETYLGTYTYGRHGVMAGTADASQLVSVPVPQLVSRETFELAQRTMRDNKLTNVKNTKSDYLLTKRLTCGQCGRKMTAITRKGKTAAGSLKLERKYVCPARAHPTGFSSRCDAPSFPVKSVDDVVWKWLRDVLSHPDLLRRGLDEYHTDTGTDTSPAQARLQVITDLLEENRKKLERVIDLYVGGDIPKELLTSRKDELSELVTSLQKEKDDLEVSLADQRDIEEQVMSVVQFAEAVGDGLAEADMDFAKRKELVGMVDLQVTLSVENGQKIALVRWALGQGTLSILSSKSSYSRALVTHMVRLVVWSPSP